MTIDECRQFYADEIRLTAGLTTPGLVEAFARVPREKFLGPGPWQIPQPRISFTQNHVETTHVTIDDPRDLYHNVLVSIDRIRGLNNGQPGSLGGWINALALKPGDQVYHLGCGVGYYTAIMAEVVGPTGSIIATEVIPELAERARANLGDYPTIAIHGSDASGGIFDPGPCDAILINAGVTHAQPIWLDRLNENGRMLIPLTFLPHPHAGGQGIMLKIERLNGAFAVKIVSPVMIYSCTSGRTPEMEAALRQALKTGALQKVKSARRDAHEPTDTCVLHSDGVCLSTLPS